MERTVIDKEFLVNMLLSGAHQLAQHAKEVDALNVFPVPDGDTGTNMNLTINSGVAELENKKWDTVGQAAQAFSRGLLMGARGNSGVILSQLFRGFSRFIERKDTITAKEFAEALIQGSQTAYSAVMKPVEGTILTVAKEAAVEAKRASEQNADIGLLLTQMLSAAKKALERTPELLPVLKEVGVVDSGGQGLVHIYTGFVEAAQGEFFEQRVKVLDTTNLEGNLHSKLVQSQLKTEDIEFGYCTEFIIKRDLHKKMDIQQFQNDLGKWGDSLLVVEDEDLVKIHVHAEFPGEVMTLAQHFGQLMNIKIENMREQHLHLVNQERENGIGRKKKTYGIIAVSAGEGFSKILKSLGVDVIVSGGQTMNPSTEELCRAVSEVNAEHIIFLPNNKNIILAAEQASKILSIPSHVVPSQTIPQAIAALLSFKLESGPEENIQEMNAAIKRVKTGQITQAVRDTRWDNKEIVQGDYLGLAEGEIVASGLPLQDTFALLLDKLVSDEDSIVTLYYGNDSSKVQAEELISCLEHQYEDIEWEIHAGGQPLYPFIFSVE